MTASVRVRLPVVLLIVVLAALWAAPARAATAASCQPTSPSGEYLAVASTQDLAQPFVAQTSGTLENVQLALSRSLNTSSDLVVEVRTFDTGTGQPVTLLASMTVSPSQVEENVVAPSGLTTVTFGSPVTLVAGETYAIVLTSTADLFNGEFYKFHTTTAPCADALLRAKTQFSQEYLPLALSGSFVVNVTAAPPPPPPPSGKPGKGCGDKNHAHVRELQCKKPAA